MPSQSLSKGWRRDINTEKLGYFRTDDETVKHLARIIAPKALGKHSPGIQLLDPCCGEGLAAQSLANAWGQVKTWGVEYDETRFIAAAKRMDRVLNTDAMGETFMSASWASVMLFNPPYGSVDARDADGKNKTERLEALFWKAHATRVTRGGLMIAILPVGVFKRAPGLVRAMSNYFGGERADVFRVVDQSYHQVVVIGYRRINRESAPNDRLRQTLVDLSENRADVPSLTQARSKSFVIDESSAPEHFDALFLTQAMAEVETAKEPRAVVDDIARDLKMQRIATNRRRTLTPLRQGHIPLLLAAGGLDGFVADDDMRLLVKGSVQRIAAQNQSVEEDGTGADVTTTTRTVKVYKWQTRILAWDLTPGRNYRLLTIQ